MQYQSWNSLRTYFKGYDNIQLHSSRYLEMLSFHISHTPANVDVFDAGSGTGILSKKLLDKGNNIISVDINKNALSYLKEKVKDTSNILIKEADLSQKFMLDKHVSVIHSMIVLPFPNDIDQYLENLYINLKRKGKLVLSSWNCVDDIYYGAIELLEEELKKKEKLSSESILEVWNDIKNKGKLFSQEIRKKNLTQEILIKKLKLLGFKEITPYPGIYNNRYTFHLTAIK